MAFECPSVVVTIGAPLPPTAPHQAVVIAGASQAGFSGSEGRDKRGQGCQADPRAGPTAGNNTASDTERTSIVG